MDEQNDDARLKQWAEREGRRAAETGLDPREMATARWSESVNAIVHLRNRSIDEQAAFDTWVASYVLGWQAALSLAEQGDRR